MSENESVQASAPPPSEDDITYQAVEKDGVVTAIWEMKGRKHIRTIDPRSEEGQRLLSGYKSNPTGENEADIKTAHT